jgi:glycosyltransferase involved in cell wall biosynthesis
VIANSQWALNYGQRQSGRSTASPSTVIYNGLSRTDLLEIAPSQKSASKAALGIAPECSLLIAVARFDRGKGQSDLIKMMARPSPYQRKLLLIGTGSGEAKLRQLVHKLGLNKSIEFIGFKEDLKPYYAAADLALSASRLDSLPNALLEAQAASLPVIAYPTAGVPEIIQHQKTGFLVKAGSIEQLNTHCTQLLSDATMTAKMGASARAHIQENFSKEGQLSKYSDLLQL